ncbi:MAG: hypothetical protein LBN10_06820 [Propionibacteriaceae bacterium]|nr:hypothetical protein [Propionibacteriaceae bacterium]
MGYKGRARWLACLGCAAALVSSLCVAPAVAEDLSAEKTHAESVVGQAQTHANQSSAAVVAATARVQAAQDRVVAAEEALESAQADFALAQTIQAAKAKELYFANQALIGAKAAEAEGQALVDAQQDAVGEYARAIFQDSYPLLSLALILNVNSPASLANRVQWSNTVLTTNQVDLDYLREIQQQLVEARAASETAQQDADKAAQDAETQVTVSAQAEKAAADAKAEIQAALQEEQNALAAASQLYANDQAQLAQAQAALDSVNARIAERARQEAEQAAAAAAAAAAAQPQPGPQPQPPSPPSGGSLSPAQAQSVAYGMVLSRGWGDAQFSCLVWLWNRESGWRWNAQNPYSGAYGIPQSLPASKMASAGADWPTNAVTQIVWGLSYISQRYGTPCGAWAHSEATGWY